MEGLKWRRSTYGRTRASEWEETTPAVNIRKRDMQELRLSYISTISIILMCRTSKWGACCQIRLCTLKDLWPFVANHKPPMIGPSLHHIMCALDRNRKVSETVNLIARFCALRSCLTRIHDALTTIKRSRLHKIWHEKLHLSFGEVTFELEGERTSTWRSSWIWALHEPFGREQAQHMAKPPREKRKARPDAQLILMRRPCSMALNMKALGEDHLLQELLDLRFGHERLRPASTAPNMYEFSRLLLVSAQRQPTRQITFWQIYPLASKSDSMIPPCFFQGCFVWSYSNRGSLASKASQNMTCSQNLTCRRKEPRRLVDADRINGQIHTHILACSHATHPKSEGLKL